MENFNKLPTTVLGNYGETFVTEFCKRNSLKCYQPSWSASFPVDAIMMTESLNLYQLEIKTKPRRIYYDDIGFDLPDWEVYTEFKSDTCVVFIDYLSKCIWMQWISKLKECVRIKDKYVYFDLDKLTKYRDLTEEEVDKLKGMSRSDY